MERSRTRFDDLDSETENDCAFVAGQKSHLSEIIEEFDAEIDKLFDKVKPLKDYKMTDNA